MFRLTSARSPGCRRIVSASSGAAIICITMRFLANRKIEKKDRGR